MQAGVGRRIGEQTEHFWSDTKPLTKLARYMSRANWWDAFNLLFIQLVRIKQAAFPALIASKVAKNKKKLGT